MSFTRYLPPLMITLTLLTQPALGSDMDRAELVDICDRGDLDRCWGYIDGVLDASQKGWAGCPPAGDLGQGSYDEIVEFLRSLYWTSNQSAWANVQVASNAIWPCAPTSTSG